MARFRNNQQHALVARVYAGDGIVIERAQRLDELALLPELASWRTWAFHITLCGTRHARHGEQSAMLVPNTVLLSGPARGPVRVRSLPGVASDTVVLWLAAERWGQLVAQHPAFARHNAELRAGHPVMARHPAPPHILRVTRQILALAEQGRPPRLALENHCGLLLRLLGELRFGPPAAEQGRAHLRVETAQRHMVEGLERPPSLEEIAAALSVSPRQLQRDFLECTGMTPMRYLSRLRLGEANLLLTETALPVAEIACRLGYPSPAAFSAAFRQIYGCSPRQVRGELTALSHDE
jgi:AraC-like DNA-binding protein